MFCCYYVPAWRIFACVCFKGVGENFASISSRQRSSVSSHPLRERMDFGYRSLQLDRPSYAPGSRSVAFTPYLL